MKIILIFLAVLIITFSFVKWVDFCLDYFDDIALIFTMALGVPVAIFISIILIFL